MANINNLTINQRATFSKTITWKDHDGSIIDLSTYSAKMQLRENYNSAIILELTSDDTSIVLTSLGVITLTIPKSKTSLLAHEDFPAKYDLVLTSATGIVKRLLQGEVILSQGVTE